MAKKLEAPSLEYLLSLRSEMESQYSDQDALIDRGRSVREQNNVIPLPDAWKLVQIEVRDPTITDEIQRVAATLSINRPTLTVTPAGGDAAGDKATANASLRERWTEAIFEQAATRVPMLHTFSMVVDAVCGDGGGWSKFLFSRDLWDTRYALRPGMFTDDPMTTADDGSVSRVGTTGAAKHSQAVEEAKRAAGSPFLDVPIDVRGLYPVWQGVRLGEVLEVSKRPISHTFRQYRLGADKDGRIVPESLGQGRNYRMPQSGSTVTFLEHWDSEWCTYSVVGEEIAGNEAPNGQIVQQWRHGYERVPYFGAYGLFMNHWRGRKVGWSVTEAKRWMVEFKSFLLTIAAQAVARDTMGSFVRTAPDPGQAMWGNDGAPRLRENYEPGVIYDLLPGQKMEPLQMPPVAESLKFLLPLVDATLAKLDSSLASDQMEGLDQSGFAMNTRLSNARIKFAPPAQNVERYLKEKTEFLWYLMRKKVRERVYVFVSGPQTGLESAAPEELTESVEIGWEVSPEQPSDLLIKQRALVEALQARLIGPTQAMEELGRNPDDVRMDLAVDEIRQSPEYKKLLQGRVLQEIGRGDLIAQAAEAQQVAQSGQVTPAMGSQGIPDMGSLAASPGGGGLAPQGPPNGSVPGAGPGAVVPTQSAVAAQAPTQGGQP